MITLTKEALRNAKVRAAAKESFINLLGDNIFETKIFYDAYEAKMMQSRIRLCCWPMKIKVQIKLIHYYSVVRYGDVQAKNE